MTRRSGAAKALVEQPGACLPLAQACRAPRVNPVIPDARQEVRALRIVLFPMASDWQCCVS
jgi:hypothetical protein